MGDIYCRKGFEVLEGNLERQYRSDVVVKPWNAQSDGAVGWREVLDENFRMVEEGTAEGGGQWTSLGEKHGVS